MSDAETQTESPPDTGDSSPEGAADASVPAAPSGEVPSVEDLVDDESIDLEASGLPDKTVAEIRKIRKDVARYRQTASDWESATTGWNPDDIDTLRTALAAAKDDPRTIGQWMMDNGKALLGDDAEPDHTPEPEPAEAGKGLSAEQIRQMVAEAMSEQSEKEQQIAKVRAEAEQVGFGPSHPLHDVLLFTASRRKIPLAEAAELLKREGGTAGTDTNSQDAPPEGGHTPVPPEGGTPAGTREVRDPKQAMSERLDKVLGSARGFAEP